MAEDIFVKVGGAQRQIAQPHVKVAGAWRQVAHVYVKVAGAWRHSWPPGGGGGGGGNTAPVLAIAVPDQTGTVGIAFSYTIPAGTFTDVDGDPLSYSLSALPAGLSFNPATRIISGTPTAIGTTSVTVTVDDGNGGTATDVFNIVVGTVNVTRPSTITIYGSDADIPNVTGQVVLIGQNGANAELSPFNGSNPLYVGPDFTGGPLPWDADYAKPASFSGSMAHNIVAAGTYADTGADAQVDVLLLAFPAAVGDDMMLRNAFGGGVMAYDDGAGGYTLLAVNDVVSVSGGQMFFAGQVVVNYNNNPGIPSTALMTLPASLNGSTFRFIGYYGNLFQMDRVT